MHAPPLDRLRARLEVIGVPLCAGIDPHPSAFPDGIPTNAAGLERYAVGLIEAVAEHVVAFKFNVAFFEAFGSEGWRALERARASVPAEIVVILDAKRGDMGPTAERYAEALLGRLAADAVTLSPYLGEDAIEPFLAFPERIVYVLARTSNPSASTLQACLVEGRPLYEVVAEWVAARWPGGRVGLVVGATAPAELRRLRQLVPELPFLVPGIGAQAGDLPAALAACHGSDAPGVVSVSRAITEASRGLDWQAAASHAARGWRGRMVETGATLAV